MSYIERYLDVVINANRGVKKSICSFDTPGKAKYFRERIIKNNHVKKAKRNHKNVTIIYEN